MAMIFFSSPILASWFILLPVDCSKLLECSRTLNDFVTANSGLRLTYGLSRRELNEVEPPGEVGCAAFAHHLDGIC